MINDIVYGGFAQLTYCHWNKLKEADFKNPLVNTKEILKLINNENIWPLIRTDESESKPVPPIYKEEDKRLFLVYSEDKKYGKIKYESLFQGWEFLYFADHKKIYKEYLNIESQYSSGMQATAFRKGNDIVIAYRGTEPSEIADLSTDLEIGFLNRHSPHLTAAVLFYEHILKEYGSNSTIHITGHSLGGALAQYVSCYAEGTHKTVTWNGLGIGVHKGALKKGISGKITDIMQVIEVNKMKSAEDIQKKYLNSGGEVVPDLDLSKRTNIINDIAGIIIKNTHEYYNQDKTEVYSFEIGDSWKGSFSMGSSHDSSYSYKLTENEVKNIETSAEIFATEIYWILKTTQQFAKSYPNLENSDTITNYFNTKDWTAMLQTRLGLCINVLQDNFNYFDEENDSKMRAIKDTIKQVGFDNHGVNDFLLYMDDNGNIQPGQLSEAFIKNSAKQYFIQARDSKKLKKILDGQNLKPENDFEENNYLKYVFGVLSRSIASSEKSKYSKLDKKWRYSEVVKNSLKSSDYCGYEKITRAEEENVIYRIGQYVNIPELAGIEGGETITLFEKIEDSASTEDRRTTTKRTEEKIVGYGDYFGGQKYKVVEEANGNKTKQAI